jgi:hypothetical protein
MKGVGIMATRATNAWLLPAVCALFFLGRAAADEKQMILTTSGGEQLQLHEDNTWSAVKNQEVLFEKDFTVPLADGRFVLINVDGTWGFVTQELIYADDLLTTSKVIGQARVTNVDVTLATQAAKKQALDNSIIKTREAVRKIKKIDKEKLKECVLAVEKDVDTQEAFTTGKGWTVQVLVTLDKGSLLAVVDCARDTAEAAKSR